MTGRHGFSRRGESMKNKTILWVLIFLICTATLTGQEMLRSGRQPSYIQFGSTFQMWKVDGYFDPVTQFAFPTIINLPLGDNFSLNISNTPAFSWWKPQNDRLSLTSISDTWVKANYFMLDEHILIFAGMGLPSGATRLDSSEYELVSQGLSRNIYRFNLPVYGQGFSFRGGVALAFPVTDRLVIGVGSHYLYRATYYPLQYTYTYTGANGSLMEGELWDESYNPGDEVVAHMGLDLQLGESLKVMFDGVYTHFGRDVLNDSTQVFGSGDKVAFYLGLYRPWDKNYLWGLLTFRQRGKNEILQGGYLAVESVNSNGFQIELNLIAKIFDFTEGGFRVYLDARYFEKDEFSDQEDWAIGGGVGVSYLIAPALQVNVMLKAFYGIMNWERRRSAIGMDSSVGLILTL